MQLITSSLSHGIVWQWIQDHMITKVKAIIMTPTHNSGYNHRCKSATISSLWTLLGNQGHNLALMIIKSQWSLIPKYQMWQERTSTFQPSDTIQIFPVVTLSSRIMNHFPSDNKTIASISSSHTLLQFTQANVFLYQAAPETRQHCPVCEVTSVWLCSC